MIHIEQNQSIPENENIFVASPTGDYEDNALIEFYNSEDPEKILGAFAAQYVKYGGLVYKFNDPKELGTEILKIEPESTHSAASFVRMQNELLRQFNQGDLEAQSLNQVLADEQEAMQEKVTDPVVEEATSTDPIAEETATSSTPTSSTPVQQIIDNTTSPTVTETNHTTTQPIAPEATTSTPSTTPEIIEPQVAGTSTIATTSDPLPEIVATTSETIVPLEQFVETASDTIPIIEEAISSTTTQI